MRLIAVVLASVLLAACGGGSSYSVPSGSAAALGGSTPPPPGAPPSPAPTPNAALLGAGKIRHVIVVIMENRTFDNLFNGYPGADSVASAKTHLGVTVPLRPAPFEAPCDPDHSHAAWVKDWDGGKMDGFDTTPAN